ncbi:MAG TPA: PTS fructose transporter subunit IIA [Thermoanaerobaculia bacterium]|jgi:mannose PTS system EIIA component|nr:PTS fructose transporter subunit IIA [Thermoanaerobaculia bacterium]
MIGKLILSHGGLAEELLRTAERIAGPLQGFRALSLSWDEGSEEAKRRIRHELKELDQGEGVLILADMFGDTPCNVAVSMLEPHRVELVSGINLPLVVRLACPGAPQTLDALAHWAVTKAQSSVRLVTGSDAQGEPPCG